MARAITPRKKIMWTALAWSLGLLIFFPILWTFLTSFKSEATAISDPPVWFFFDWTTENYSAVLERSNYPLALTNSIIIAVGSTLLGILIAVPAAWAMAFVPGKRTKDVLLWMLSTKMLPAVGVLYPMVLIAKYFNVLDSRILLVVFMASGVGPEEMAGRARSTSSHGLGSARLLIHTCITVPSVRTHTSYHVSRSERYLAKLSMLNARPFLSTSRSRSG